MGEELFASLPGVARRAVNGLLLAGLLWLAFGAVGLYVTISDGADGFREYLTVYMLFIGVGSMSALVLLLRGRSAGRTTAWVVLPFILIFFPVGTAVGAYIITGLHSDDMRRHLAPGS